MRLLLDTRIYLWCVNDDKHLTKPMRTLISHANEVFVSSVSIWEISMKIKQKKLHGHLDKLIAAIAASGFSELPLLATHLQTENQLADHHQDPFDRLLIAQALTETLRLVTVDPVFQPYSELIELV